MDEQVINRIAEILGQSGDAAVSEYVRWHVTQAVLWIVVAATGAVVALRWKIPPTKSEYDTPPRGAWVALKVGVVCVMVLIGGCHVPDLVAPRAISIHQLLHDIRG